MKRSRDEAQEYDATANPRKQQEHEKNAGAHAEEVPSAKIDGQHVDIDDCFKDMVEAAKAAGAYWNPKLCRSIAKESDVAGIFAREGIVADEVLCCIPASLQLSLPSFRKAMPQIFAAFDALPMQDSSRTDEAAHVACITRLFVIALEKKDFAASGEDQACATLWNLCAKALLGIDFSEHPYHRSLRDVNTWRHELSPSGESEHAHGLANYILSVYKGIRKHAPQELFSGEGLNLTLFFHAWLCLLTREFGGPHGSTLVPLVDYFNHASDAGAKQVWDDDTQAVVIKAIRAHAPGDAVCIEYGKLSNPLLFRTYGFTLPVEQEPASTCTFSEEELQALCKSNASFTNPDFAVHLATLPNLHLHAGEVTQTLTLIIRACSRYDVTISAFLRGVCSERAKRYKRTDRFEQSYCRLRSCPIDNASKTAADENGSGDSHIQEDIRRVQVSELFCLEVHLEAMDCVAGKVDEKQCHPRAAGLREDLRVLQSAGLWT